MEIGQGQDSNFFGEIKELSGESEDETIKTDSKQDGDTGIPVYKKLEPKEDIFPKAKGERGGKLPKISKENIQYNKTEESKNPPGCKIPEVLGDNYPEIIYSEQTWTSENKNSDTFIRIDSTVLPDKDILLKKSKASLKSENDDSKISKLENVVADNLENDSQQIEEGYEPEEIKELVSEIKQKVMEQREHGSPERFISLSHYILSKHIIETEQEKSISPLILPFDYTDIGECKQLFSFGGDFNKSNQDVLLINFDFRYTLKVISQLDTRIASFKLLAMLKVPKNNADIKMFLSHYFPEEGDEFRFNDENKKIINFGYYHTALLQAVSRVSEKVGVGCCNLSQEEMINFMAEAKSLNTLEFKEGELDLDSVPQFGSSLEDSKIK